MSPPRLDAAGVGSGPRRSRMIGRGAYEPLNPTPPPSPRTTAAGAEHSLPSSTFDVEAQHGASDSVGHAAAAPGPSFYRRTTAKLSGYVTTLRGWTPSPRTLKAGGILVLLAFAGHNATLESRVESLGSRLPKRPSSPLEHCAEIGGNDDAQSMNFYTQNHNYQRSQGLCTPAGKEFAKKMSRLYAEISDEADESKALNCTQYGIESRPMAFANYIQFENNRLKALSDKEGRALTPTEVAHTHDQMRSWAKSSVAGSTAQTLKGIKFGFDSAENASASADLPNALRPSAGAKTRLKSDLADLHAQLAHFELPEPDPSECATEPGFGMIG